MNMKNKKIVEPTFFWALQGLLALHRTLFSVELARQQLAAAYTTEALQQAKVSYGLMAVSRKVNSEKLPKESFPLVAWLCPNIASERPMGICCKWLQFICSGGH